MATILFSAMSKFETGGGTTSKTMRKQGWRDGRFFYIFQKHWENKGGMTDASLPTQVWKTGWYDARITANIKYEKRGGKDDFECVHNY